MQPAIYTSAGRYKLFERIAVGGMAEIYRGVVIGAAGFERPVVIKKILPELVREEAFTQMLINEAKLAASLTHANIVQILDLGASPEGEYFIVMEQVDGRDLADVMEAEADRGRALGPALAVHVALEVLRALDYAHTKRDPQGTALNLVHRDISPSNIMISFAGEVKLTDFGIAKRQTDVSTIDALKGKLGYLSPEQSQRSQVDARSDLYSLGIVLYEMIVGERLFAAATARELLALHRAVQRPPSPRAARADVPIGLDRVVQHALEPRAEKRFQAAQEFSDGLSGLQRAGLRAGPDELKALIRTLFPQGTAQAGSRGEGTMLTLTSLAAAAQAKLAPPRNGQREAAPRAPVGTERLADPLESGSRRREATSVAKHRQRSDARRSEGGSPGAPAKGGRAPAGSTPDSFFDEGPGMALVATDTEPMANLPVDARQKAVIRPQGGMAIEPGRGRSAFEEDATAPPSGPRGRRKAAPAGDNDATLVIDRRKALLGSAETVPPSAARSAEPARRGKSGSKVEEAEATAERGREREEARGTARVKVPGLKRPRDGKPGTDEQSTTWVGAPRPLWRRVLPWALFLVLVGASAAGGMLLYLGYFRRG